MAAITTYLQYKQREKERKKEKMRRENGETELKCCSGACICSVSVHLQQVMHQPDQVSGAQLLWKAAAHSRQRMGRQRVCQDIRDNRPGHAHAEEAQQCRQIQTRYLPVSADRC